MQLGWIDFSKTDRNKVINVLELLTERGTLDELGIAPIRDGFADIFSPGTSTIQTRAKYFFIIPYAAKELEINNLTSQSDMLNFLDARERECAESLLDQHNNDEGIIGKRALQKKRWVKRTPADIYWSGLRRYGILKKDNISLTVYVKLLAKFKKENLHLKTLGNRHDNIEDNECDDNRAGNLVKPQFWNMPLYSTDWFNKLHIELTKDEAIFLKDQIIIHCPDSILAYVLKHNITEFVTCSSFSDLTTIINKFPAKIQESYTLALSFSNFIYTLRTLYNIIISDQKNSLANKEWSNLSKKLSEISNVQLNYLFTTLQIKRDSSFTQLEFFLLSSQEAMRVKNSERLKELIIAREEKLKGTSRAKTKHIGEFNTDVWFGGKELNYRFFNAQTIVADIMHGEGTI